MAYAIQCCVTCGKLESGHTGPADRYTCEACEYPQSEVSLGAQREDAYCQFLELAANNEALADKWMAQWERERWEAITDTERGN